MAEALRLLLLVLALGTGLAAITFCGLLFQARRTSLFRALLANIFLFNLLVLGGLVFWYARLHLGRAGPGAATAVVAGLAIVKVAWLVAFLTLAGSLVSEGAGRKGVAFGVALLVLHWGLLGAGWLSGRPWWLDVGFGFVELAVPAGALGAAFWVLRASRRAAGPRRRSLIWFGGFHAVVFTAMLGWLARGWLRPETAQAAPVASSLLMAAYNLFPLLWVRAFHSDRRTAGSGELDRYGITPREREIIGLIRSGKTNQEIADELFISLATVKDHNYNIFRKTGVRNRVELINLLRDDPPRSH